jgi:hypothetical protein
MASLHPDWVNGITEALRRKYDGTLPSYEKLAADIARATGRKVKGASRNNLHRWFAEGAHSPSTTAALCSFLDTPNPYDLFSAIGPREALILRSVREWADLGARLKESDPGQYETEIGYLRRNVRRAEQWGPGSPSRKNSS